jgi:hypothetical protein
MSQIAGLTDADFRRTILRAIRLTAIVVAVGVPLVWWKLGWQSAAYLVVGGAISASGLYEWLRLMTAVMHRMDVPTNGEPTKVRPMVPILIGFFLRMGIALVALYVTLKTLDGSVYALAAGLALGVFALSVEAFRLMRVWTV